MCGHKSSRKNKSSWPHRTFSVPSRLGCSKAVSLKQQPGPFTSTDVFLLGTKERLTLRAGEDSWVVRTTYCTNMRKWLGSYYPCKKAKCNPTAGRSRGRITWALGLQFRSRFGKRPCLKGLRWRIIRYLTYEDAHTTCTCTHGTHICMHACMQSSTQNKINEAE